jgi:hypothetical protein
LRALSVGAADINDVIESMRVEPARAMMLIDALAQEGLLRRVGKQLTLP